MGFIGAILIGGLAGWLAEKVMRSDISLIGNILLGVAGGVVGAWVAGFIGIAAYGVFGRLLIATAGACLLIWIGRLVWGRA